MRSAVLARSSSSRPDGSKTPTRFATAPSSAPGPHARSPTPAFCRPSRANIEDEGRGMTDRADDATEASGATEADEADATEATKREGQSERSVRRRDDAVLERGTLVGR